MDKVLYPTFKGMWKILTDYITLKLSVIPLTVSFNSRISPRTSTSIFLVKSPPATAFVTSAIERTWLFSDEVTRVAREVGTEGKLEGQVRVANVGGTWKDLTDNVNVMANNVGGCL